VNAERRSPSAAADAAPLAAQVMGVAITRPVKVWWPREGITKLEVARYYAAMSPRLTPWLNERPLVVERCPDGLAGDCFIQKNFSSGLRAGTPTVTIPVKGGRRTTRYVVGGSPPTVVALVNLGGIAIHVMNCRRGALDRPDWMAFDLDPEQGGFAAAARVGQLLRALLASLGVRGYPKTSGGRGLHVLVPLRRGPTQAEVRGAARAIAERLAAHVPSLATTASIRAERGGRVFIDVLRNAFGQTIVAPYAVRCRPGAPVSTPLTWEEVQATLDPAALNLRTIERRLADRDPWHDFWARPQRLPTLTRSRTRPRRNAPERSGRR
jgi:bifunctional non-homologous end joining protein LigD